MSCFKKNIENSRSITVTDVNASGDITISNNTAASTATLLVESKGDAHLWLKSDSDNVAVETEHPIIALSQDGQTFWSTIGFDNTASINNLVIRAGNSTGGSSDIVFYVDGDSSGAMTSPRGGLNTGTNIMTLTNNDVTVDGKLLIQPGTGSEGGEIQIYRKDGLTNWVIDSDGSDRLRILGTDPADGTDGSSWLLLAHNTTNNDATMAGGFLDINMTGDITIDTTDTTDGIKIGTVTATVPVEIGNSTGDTVLNSDVIMMANLPTGDPSNSGQLWSNSGVLTISSG